MLTGGAGHKAHTKEVTGLTRLNDVVGRWRQTPPARFDEGELRSRERCLGTGNVRMRAAKYRKQDYDHVNQKVFRRRNHYGLRNCQGRNTARAGGPNQRRGFAARAVVQPER